MRKVSLLAICLIFIILASVRGVLAEETLSSTEEITTSQMTDGKVTTAATDTTRKQKPRKRKEKVKKKENTIIKKKVKKKIQQPEKVKMPKRVVSIKGCESIQNRIHKLEKSIIKKKQKIKKLKQQKVVEQQKKEALENFNKKYCIYDQKTDIQLLGIRRTLLVEYTKDDMKFQKELYELANNLHDEKLKLIADSYVFGMHSHGLKLEVQAVFDLESYLKSVRIISEKDIQQKINITNRQIQRCKKKISEEKENRFFDPEDVSSESNLTVGDAKRMLRGTALYSEADSFIKAERVYHINAVFLMGIAAHESAWGTSRRAREDNNLTGFGVYSDSAIGINGDTKEENLLDTAKLLHNSYLTVGGKYFEGTSAADINKHYCVGNEWASAVVQYAYTLMKRL